MNILRCLFGLLAAALLALPAAADEDLYKSGLNVYVRLTEKESGAPPNEHPVTLNSKEIANALLALEVWEKKGFFSDLFSKEDGPQRVFSESQAGTLGLYIAEGLRKATPGQDIVFTLARHESGFLKIRETTYTAGRAFYADGRLNVILGDFARPIDRFQERAYQSSGISEVRYYFSHGKRSKASDFKFSVMPKAGIELAQVGGKARSDWFRIDVPTASATYMAELQQAGEGEEADPKASAAVQAEAARLAAERRELRLEMARMRKEMRELSGGEGGDRARSVEERMQTLNALYEKKLITTEEYEAKRKEILGDI
jgi:hypothetical protein